jgi:hypothetical protein
MSSYGCREEAIVYQGELGETQLNMPHSSI